jgi:hypothetical protein
MILKKREYWIGMLTGGLMVEWTHLFFAALPHLHQLQQGIGK